MKFIRISIVIPSLNQGDYLSECLESIVNQKYPNYEIILIDGGSSDNTKEVIKKFKNHIYFWSSNKDSGQAQAINEGLKIATGEFVCWQNSDDFFAPNVFFNLNNIAQKNKNAKLIMGNMSLVDRNSSTVKKLLYIKPSYSSLLADGMLIANQSTFWRKDIHNDIGFINTSYKYIFDMDWFYRLVRHLKKTEIVFVNRELGFLRLHNRSKTHKFPKRFILEYSKFKKSHKYYTFFRAFKFLFLFRRAFILILRGDINYVFLGFRARLFKLNLF